MNRIYDKTLIDDLARQLSLPAPLARQGAEEILAIIREGLIRDGVVNVTDLGSFRLKPVAARAGFNPRTRERITIPAHHRVVFTPAKALRDQAEPQRQPSVPINPEASDIPAPAVSAPAAVIPAVTDEPRPPAEAEYVEALPLAMPELRLDSAPLPPAEGEPFPPSIPAPGTGELSAEPYFPAPAGHACAMAAAPAPVYPAIAENTGLELTRIVAAEKAARAPTKRHYYLGAAAALLLGAYLAFQLNSAPEALSAKPASAAAAEPAAAAVSQPANFYFREQTVEIARGDSLWRLAGTHYQSSVLWPHIYQANTATIDDPDYLAVGEAIVIPGLQGPPENLSEADRRNIAQGYYLAYLFYKTTGRSDAPFALLMARFYDARVVDRVSQAR